MRNLYNYCTHVKPQKSRLKKTFILTFKGLSLNIDYFLNNGNLKRDSGLCYENINDISICVENKDIQNKTLLQNIKINQLEKKTIIIDNPFIESKIYNSKCIYECNIKSTDGIFDISKLTLNFQPLSFLVGMYIINTSPILVSITYDNIEYDIFKHFDNDNSKEVIV